MMRGFCPEGACLDGVMYGGGFVRKGFVRRGFCPTFPNIKSVPAADASLGGLIRGFIALCCRIMTSEDVTQYWGIILYQPYPLSLMYPRPR